MESYKCFCGAYTTNEDGICDLCLNETDENESELNNDSLN